MNNITTSSNPSNSIIEVLLALEKRTAKNIHVADVMQVTRVNSGSFTCSALYNNNVVVEANSLMSLSVHQNDIVLVLFTDHKYIDNLHRLKNNHPTLNSEEDATHSTLNGIIVGVVYRKETN